ncbi:MAG TPA: metal-dependent hydrolase [Candidatus Thermoplasmatota archaeon]|nr:metal-dependent hydrolase [Candidatus Thermoplasmatota archaeon]
MPTAVVHLIVPPLALLSTGAFRPRLVLAMCLLGLLPDLDFFVGVHRASLHNVFLLLPFLAVGLLWWRDANPQRAFWGEANLLAFAFLGSHILMDVFVGGVVPFWPVSNVTFRFDVRVLVDTATLEIESIFRPATQEGAPVTSPIYEWLDGTEFSIVALTVVVVAAVLLRGRLALLPGIVRRAVGRLTGARRL